MRAGADAHDGAVAAWLAVAAALLLRVDALLSARQATFPALLGSLAAPSRVAATAGSFNGLPLTVPLQEAASLPPPPGATEPPVASIVLVPLFLPPFCARAARASRRRASICSGCRRATRRRPSDWSVCRNLLSANRRLVCSGSARRQCQISLFFGSARIAAKSHLASCALLDLSACGALQYRHSSVGARFSDLAITVGISHLASALRGHIYR